MKLYPQKKKCGDDKLIFDDGKKVYIPDGAKLDLYSVQGNSPDEAVKKIDEINSQGGKITGAVISVGGTRSDDTAYRKSRQSWNVGNARPVPNGKRLFCGAVAYRCFYINSAIMKRGFPRRGRKTYFHILIRPTWAIRLKRSLQVLR